MNQPIATPFGNLTICCGVDDINPESVISSFSYRNVIAKDDAVVRLGFPMPVKAPSSYRELMFSRGQYLGHHVGLPGVVAVGEDDISVFIPDGDAAAYRRVLWNYCIKLYLSRAALKASALHLKATTLVDSEGRLILLVGRGGSGKTTLAGALTGKHFQVAGNTHAIVRRGHAWALNSWVRSRSGQGTTYLSPSSTDFVADGPISRIVIVDHNQLGQMTCRRVPAKEAFGFFCQFVYATGAYDLKEDLSDLAKGLQDSMKMFAIDSEQIADLLCEFPVSYLSADLMMKDGTSRIMQFFLNGD